MDVSIAMNAKEQEYYFCSMLIFCNRVHNSMYKRQIRLG